MKHLYFKAILLCTYLLESINAFAYDFEVNGIYYNILSAADKTVEVTSGNNKYSNIVQIPEKCVYSGLTFTVTEIGENAFYKTTVEEVQLPSSITNIGKSAFMYCEQLHTCNLREGLKEIGVYAFVSTNLTSVVIPSTVTTIGTYAFEGCKMKTIEFSEGISKIADHAFSSCYSLEKIIFPSTLKSVKAGVFDNCPKLKIIVSKAKNSPYFYDSYWFSGGRGTHTLYNPFTYSDSNDKPIYAILVPEGSLESYKSKTTSDGKQAWPVATFEEFNEMTDFSVLGETMTFENCCFSIVNSGKICHLQLIDKSISEDIVDLHIPQGLDYNGTFYDISSINPSYIGKYKSITSVQVDLPEPISISEETFSSNTMLFGTLYIPTGAKSLYEAATGWKDFGLIVETYNINVSTSTGGTVNVFNNNLSDTSLSVSVKEGESVTLSIEPNTGYCLKSLVVNGTDVTKDVVGNAYTISAVSQNTTIEVTFTELPTYLTIKSADNGSVAQEVEKGKTYSFVITPNEGWNLESVSFNGNNVTSEMEGSKYTTPAITSDSEINIVYKQSESDAFKGIRSESDIKITASYGKISILNNGTTTHATIYNTTGYVVTSETIRSGTTTIPLPTNNVYIIKVGNETFKVAL